jgi:surface antigen/LysM repeat protein
MKRMDWMDFLLKFSSELLVIILSLLVGGLNLFYFYAGNYQDQSLAGNFISHHQGVNPLLYAKNNSIITEVAGSSSIIPQAQAEDFIGLDSQTAVADDSTNDNSDIIIGNQDTILAPNPDSVQSLIQKQIKIYETQSGDTLASISQQFGISQQTIMWANKLTSPNIKPGWELIILPTDGVLVTATANDTLPDIAHEYNPEKYNTDATVRENSANALLQSIISYNALDGAEDINPGDLIIIPGGQIVLPPAPPVTPKPKSHYTPQPDYSMDEVTSLGDGYDGVNHIFPTGYCTYYVASQMKITFGGNAKNWLANAKASGYVTGSQPASRSAVVMTGPTRTMRLYGHVAYVDSVNDDGTITISEMNYDHFDRVDTRTISAHDPSIRGFIYP